MTDTRIVYGFPGAGKTSYIRDCIMNDPFYKYGKTLVLCFEQGREDYDAQAFKERNACVAYYGDHMDVADFCGEEIRKAGPDRIYVEMSTDLPGIRRKLPEMMNVTSAVTLIEWSSMDRYLNGSRQILNQMVSESQQVTFRGCPSKELLAPYSQEFRLMNHRASYLRQDPMGYHERAFDLFVPFALDAEKIEIKASDYLVFWLDAAEHPEHYDGKLLSFTDPLELRQAAGGGKSPLTKADDLLMPGDVGDMPWSAGRVVMTCCMSDLQFMSFELMDEAPAHGGWITLEAVGRAVKDGYGRRVLKLVPERISQAAPPEGGTILQALRRSGAAAAAPAYSPEEMFRRISASKSRSTQS